MYSQHEISKQKQAFWTAFGKYMQPVLSAEGLPVTWVNYKTGVPGLSFKMDADNNEVSIAIVIKKEAYYNRLSQMKQMLIGSLEENDWVWQPEMISKTLTGVSIHRQSDWPAMISFLKPRIIALDEFWSTWKYGFEDLV